MTITEQLTGDDLEQIDVIYWKYHSKNFYIPSLIHTVTHATIKDNEGKLLAFGMVKLFPEAILILDKGASLRDRAQAWRMLLNKAINDSRAAGHEFLYATIHDENYSSLLSKHYGFKDAPGKQVFLEL